MGRSVLVVDADLRRPTFRVSGEGEHIGLIHLLTGQANVHDAIRRGPYGIDFLLGGGTPPNPSELFAGGKVASVIEQLSVLYDIVIIDAPPILGFIDAPLLSSFTEATVVVFESARVRTAHAQSSIDKLTSAGANIVGGLITKFKKKDDEYGYSYGYGYGYGSNYEESAITGPEARRRTILIDESRRAEDIS